MKAMIDIFLLVVYIGYVLLEGYREGYYWHYKTKFNNVKGEVDIHDYFTLQRGLFMILIAFIDGYYNIINDYPNLYVKDIVLTLLATMLMFPFLHNGMYYTTRNSLKKDIYTKRFFDQSTTTTTTKFWTGLMTPISRTIFFVIGLIVFFMF